MMASKRRAAKTINSYFISKVDSLRAASKSADMASNAAHPATETADSAVYATNQATNVAELARETAKPLEKSAFKFTFATAGQITKIIHGLKATEAMGINDIPTSILKKGVEVLAGPISHLVNRSLAEGTRPKGVQSEQGLPRIQGQGEGTRGPSVLPTGVNPAGDVQGPGDLGQDRSGKASSQGGRPPRGPVRLPAQEVMHVRIGTRALRVAHRR
jgi:hypothetical protein